MSHLANRHVFLAAIVLLLAPACFSQTYYGTFVGIVTDTSGAVFPGVEVTITNVDTNISARFLSNEAGNYRAPNLIPGRYTISAEKPGFKKFVAENVQLTALAERRVDVNLEVGAVTESVTVAAGAQLVETEKATFADTKENRVFTYMPVNSNYRSIWRMLDLTPGANYTSGSNYAGNGQGRNTTYTIDGIKVMDGWTGNSFGPSLTYMDSYREFRFDLVSANASAPTSANISVISESGTNEIHGEAWMHYNAIGFSARPFFAPARPHGPPIFRPNVKAGMPLVIPHIYNGKDRTFLHFSWQGLRGSQTPYTANFVTPTQQFRAGDFSSITANLVDPLNGVAFPNKQIPASRISSVSKYYQDKFYPMPTSGDRFTGIYVFPNASDQYTARTDHRISSKNSIFGRFQRQTYVYTQYDGGTNPNVGLYDQWRDQYVVGISDTHVVSPTVINELRLGYGRDDSLYGGQNRGLDIVKASGLVLKDLEDVRALPRMDITGFQSIYQGDQNGWTWSNFHFTENVLWAKGKHNFRFGVDRDKFNGRQLATSPSRVFGTYGFNGRFSGNPYADFLLGIMNTSSRYTSVGRVYPHRTNWEMYFTDDYKITPRLSLSYGLRYSFLDPGQIEQDLIANFVPSANALVVPTDAAKSRIHPGFPKNIPIKTASEAGISQKLLNRDNNNVAPRLGFAWRPTTSNTFVIRGGAGVYNVAMQPYISDGGGAPYELQESFTNAITNGRPDFAFPTPFPGTTYQLVGTSGSGMNPDTRTPYSMQYNFTVEKEVFDMGLSFTYMSTLFRKNTWSRNLNQVRANTTPYLEKLKAVPFPYLNAVTYSENGGAHNYNGAVVKAERRFKSGLYYQAHLTMAKSVADDWGTPEDAYDRRRERSQGSAIPRWRGVVVALYDLPFGKGKKFGGSAPGVVNHLINNWMLAGTYVYRTGLYITPSFSASDPSNTNRFGGRPDRIADGNLPSDQRTLQRWFDTTAFVAPPAGIGRFGTSGANIILGPSLSVFHFGTTKEIQLREKLRLKLEMVSTNFFNHPNFSNPALTIGTSTYGSILGTVGTDGNRDFQLTARFVF